MDNSEATLQCQNLTCLAPNPATNKFCQKCGTPLVRRYLWVLGDWIKTYYHPGSVLEERYLFKQQQIVLDTKPALSPQAPEEFPNHITPYLKLFSHRLHIPQIYGYIPTPDERIDMTVWLLEYGTIPTNEEGELKYPNLLPELTQLWPQASALRQLNWLGQMAKLWQPLKSKGVASSLLNPALLRVNDRTFQLLELHLDTNVTVNFKQLGKLWSQWVTDASPRIQSFLEQLCQQLENGLITRSEQLVSIIDQALWQLGQSQKRTYQIFTYSDQGPSREHNEDSCYPISDQAITIEPPNIPLAIVCDGIGGQEGGEIASSLAVEILSREMTRFYGESTSWNPHHSSQAIEKAISIANDEISGRNDQENRHERQRMGTTLVAGLAYAHEMYIAHVGDSRVYWITPLSCQQVTTDDDLASREVRLGYLAYRDAVQYPNAGALVQALGMSGSSSLHPTIQRFVLDESSVFLLCSDGLSDYDRIEQFWESEIVPILNDNKDVTEVGRQLIKIANEKNGHDNVTIALIYCQVESNEQEDQTPLSFSELESSVSSLSGPTLIEDTQEIKAAQEGDDIPTELTSGPSSATIIPPASPKSTPAPRAARSGSGFPLSVLWGLLGAAILVIIGGIFGQKWFFPDQPNGESPSSSPATSPESQKSLAKGDFIQITTPTEFIISPENASPPSAENKIQISKDNVFQVLDTKNETVLLKNCSPQTDTKDNWILQSSVNRQTYKVIHPISDGVQLSKNCQEANSLDSSPSVSPSGVISPSSPKASESPSPTPVPK
ncbi:protein phosphatase 2C domain-containing protein [Gloeothece verrucosa]|uniref:Protein serine/threonine phosphatase n=1 Tax=Gloeothece verrucosa (strain PCC 7822) TaxID=497965 RepID=E0U8H3_GLOV7|nr:protein phosphatase 2C domain-containing protein [Gloeothece verrucosa]ADN13719.1 protein serine/threonine phosphatase [Gloeothece verrucosa PCC 7822]